MAILTSLVTAAVVFLGLGTGGDLPPSRAGDVMPAANYERELTDVLRDVVDSDGWVDYDRLRGDADVRFRSVLKAVEDFDISSLASDESRMAFWINAYNVQMLANLVAHPEVENIIEDGMADEFFRTQLRTANLSLSLDEIEHGILRGPDGHRSEVSALKVARLEPRIHVALNCGALSCPRLMPCAFDDSNIESLLERAMRTFVNSTRHFRGERGRLVASSLIDWYGTDFDLPTGAAGDFLLRYLDEDNPHAAILERSLAGATSIEIRQSELVRFEYLWRTNDVANASTAY